MFNERNMQQQLKNFQKQSQVHPQRMQNQSFPSCNIQPVSVMPQVPQHSYQQAQQGMYHQPYPQASTGVSSGAVRWQTQQPYQEGLQSNNRAGMMVNSNYQQQHQAHQPQVQHQPQHPKNGPLPSKGAKHRSISLPIWLEKAICRSAKNSINIEAESLSQQSIREMYTRALGLVECTNFPAVSNNSSMDTSSTAVSNNISGCCKQCASLPPAWVETERVSLLLLRTGVPAGMLALLWELVNCSRPGQLTRRECAALLALIALVQSGQQLVSADVLLKLAEPVVPVIDHPALVPFLQQFQQQQQQQTNHTTVNEDNDDDFDDFVAATFPSATVTNNNNCFGVSSAALMNSKALHNQGTATVTASQTIPAFSQQPSLTQAPLQASLPLINSNQSNIPLTSIPTTSQSLSVPNNAVVDKRMNLPQVGRSPDMSPSLSFDNSQEDDFDDFQSATSDPSGLVSTDGSPRIVTAPHSDSKATPSPNLELGNVGGGGGSLTTLPKSDIGPLTTSENSSAASGCLASSQTNSMNMSSTNVISAHLNSEKRQSYDLPKAPGVVLQPAKVSGPSSDGDRYAAFRDFDFGSDTPEPVLKASGMDLYNGSPPATGQDDSFGDFCSVEKDASAEDDEFGDFAAANFEKLTMPDVLQSTKSLNSAIKQLHTNVLPLITNLEVYSPNKDKPAVDNSLHVGFDADFSSLDLNCYSSKITPTSDVQSLPNISSDKANTSDWTTGFDLKPSGASKSDSLTDTAVKKEDPSGIFSTTSYGSSVDTAKQSSSGMPQQVEGNKIAASLVGPSDWSDIFGVLHDNKRSAAAASQPQPVSLSHPVSVMPWSEEPPPLPNSGDNDDLGEFNDDFGEFLGPTSSVASTSEELCSKGPVLPFVLSRADSTASTSVGPVSVAPPPFSFPDCEPPTINNDGDSNVSQLESVVTVAPGKEANVAAVLSTISESLPLDKYSSIREDSGPCSGGGAEECWQRCLLGCQQLLQAGVAALEPLATKDMDGHKLTNTQPLRDYLAGLLEVVCVSARVRTAAQSLPVNASLQASLSLVTDLQDRLVSTLQALQESVFVESVRTVDSSIPKAGHGLDDPSNAMCAVCLTLISDGASTPPSRSLQPVLSTKLSSPSPSVDPCRSSQGSSLHYGGHCYHPGCANLWLNCVDLTLPALPASSATLL